LFFFPGPFWARAMRSSFRKESFPICFLAPSDVKSSAVVATICLVLVDVLVENAFWGRTKADAREVVHAIASAVNVNLTILMKGL
jgi:hypothetical protein